MVMGRTHSLHGLTASLAMSNVVPLLGLPMNISIAASLGLLGAGAAIAPDLDHPGAIATRSLGWLSLGASRVIRTISAWTYRHTKTAEDRPNADGHRGITHTIPGALGLGAVFGGACALAGLWSSLAGSITAGVVIWVFLVWALRALPPKHSRMKDYSTATVLAASAWFALDHSYAAHLPLLIGITIAGGAWVHSLGDALTDYGSPLWFPLKRRGERWYGAGMPKLFRFKAGKEVEERAIYPLSIVLAVAAAVWAIPGAWPMIFRVAGAAWDMIV